VGVVGTGATAVQAIPEIAQQAKQLTVFQRTANYCVPARNGKVDPFPKTLDAGFEPVADIRQIVFDL
jgi:cation diffusion facilitator CzcD-associated flavoprotein CzcO